MNGRLIPAGLARPLLVAVLVSAVMAVSACAAPNESRTTDRAAASGLLPSELGPYSLNVVAIRGKREFSVTGVRVEATDTVAGYPMGGVGPSPARARPGHHLVEVTLREHDTGVSSKPTSDVATITATADGAAAPETGGYDRSVSSDWSVVDHVIQFEFPDGTREALLHLTTSTDASQTIAFTLW